METAAEEPKVGDAWKETTMAGDRDYWEARARGDDDPDTFEWFLLAFERLRPHLASAGALDPRASVLEAGCGTSRLALDLGAARAEEVRALEAAQRADAGEEEEEGGAAAAVAATTGLGALVSFDYSSTIVERQRRRQQEEVAAATAAAAVDFRVMDARALPLPDGTFDVLVDKGTLDAMDVVDGAEGAGSVVDGAEGAGAQGCAEYARVLKDGGRLCIVTCRPPRRRLASLAAALEGQRQRERAAAATTAMATFTLTACAPLKLPGQERAPGGCSLLLLTKSVDRSAGGGSSEDGLAARPAAVDASLLDQLEEREQAEWAQQADACRAAAAAARGGNGAGGAGDAGEESDGAIGGLFGGSSSGSGSDSDSDSDSDSVGRSKS